MHSQSQETLNRAGRDRRMQGGEHEMAAIGGTNRSDCGFGIANFANHDHIGRLPQNGAKQVREFYADLGIHLRLANAGDRVFDRIFDRVELAAAIMKHAKAGVERRRFARSGRAADEDESAPAMKAAI